jgi:aminopeptidase N
VFDEPLPPKSEVTVEFAMEAVERSIQAAFEPGFALASWVEYWYPIPGTREEEFGSPAAPGSTTIRMPPDWRAVAPGVLAEVREMDGKRVETWVSEQPVARSFAAGPLTRVDVNAAGSVPVSFFVLQPSDTYRARAEVLGRAITAMEQRFGAYPYPSWNVVEIPNEVIGFGAAAEQGFIMVRSSVLANESGALPLLAHEAGHAWWGNRMQTRGEGGRMLGEALAQYGAAVAIEALEGPDAAIRFLRFSREGYNPLQCALGYFAIARQGDDEPLAVLEGNEGHNLADSKGMWFHHMLRGRLGDERYFGALRALFARFDGSQATLDGFRAMVAEAAVDDPGMERFLAQWLDRTGAPEVDVTWWSINRGKGVEVILEQTQPGDPYELDLELAIGLDDGTTAFERVRLADSSETFKIEVPARPLAVRLDPNHRLLLWRPEYGSPLSRSKPPEQSPQ